MGEPTCYCCSTLKASSYDAAGAQRYSTDLPHEWQYFTMPSRIEIPDGRRLRALVRHFGRNFGIGALLPALHREAERRGRRRQAQMARRRQREPPSVGESGAAHNSPTHDHLEPAGSTGAREGDEGDEEELRSFLTSPLNDDVVDGEEDETAADGTAAADTLIADAEAVGAMERSCKSTLPASVWAAIGLFLPLHKPTLVALGTTCHLLRHLTDTLPHWRWLLPLRSEVARIAHHMRWNLAPSVVEVPMGSEPPAWSYHLFSKRPFASREHPSRVAAYGPEGPAGRPDPAAIAAGRAAAALTADHIARARPDGALVEPNVLAARRRHTYLYDIKRRRILYPRIQARGNDEGDSDDAAATASNFSELEDDAFRYGDAAVATTTTLTGVAPIRGRRVFFPPAPPPPIVPAEGTRAGDGAGSGDPGSPDVHGLYDPILDDKQVRVLLQRFGNTAMDATTTGPDTPEGCVESLHSISEREHAASPSGVALCTASEQGQAGPIARGGESPVFAGLPDPPGMVRSEDGPPLVVGAARENNFASPPVTAASSALPSLSGDDDALGVVDANGTTPPPGNELHAIFAAAFAARAASAAVGEEAAPSSSSSSSSEIMVPSSSDDDDDALSAIRRDGVLDNPPLEHLVMQRHFNFMVHGAMRHERIARERRVLALATNPLAAPAEEGEVPLHRMTYAFTLGDAAEVYSSARTTSHRPVGIRRPRMSDDYLDVKWRRDNLFPTRSSFLDVARGAVSVVEGVVYEHPCTKYGLTLIQGIAAMAYGALAFVFAYFMGATDNAYSDRDKDLSAHVGVTIYLPFWALAIVFLCRRGENQRLHLHSIITGLSTCVFCLMALAVPTVLTAKRMHTAGELLSGGVVDACDAWGAVTPAAVLAAQTSPWAPSATTMTRFGNVGFNRTDTCALPTPLLPVLARDRIFTTVPTGSVIVFFPPSAPRIVPLATNTTTATASNIIETFVPGPAAAAAQCILFQNATVAPLAATEAGTSLPRGPTGAYAILLPCDGPTSCAACTTAPFAPAVIIGNDATVPFWAPHGYALDGNDAALALATNGTSIIPVDSPFQATLAAAPVPFGFLTATALNTTWNTTDPSWAAVRVTGGNSATAGGNGGHALQLRSGTRGSPHYTASAFQRQDGADPWSDTAEWQGRGVPVYTADTAIMYARSGATTPTRPRLSHVYSLSYDDDGEAPLWSAGTPAGLRRLQQDFHAGALSLVVSGAVFLGIVALAAFFRLRRFLVCFGSTLYALLTILPIAPLVIGAVCLAHASPNPALELTLPSVCLSTVRSDAVPLVIFSSVCLGITVLSTLIVCLVSD